MIGLTTITLEYYAGKLNEEILFIPYSVVALFNKIFSQSSMVLLLGNTLATHQKEAIAAAN